MLHKDKVKFGHMPIFPHFYPWLNNLLGQYFDFLTKSSSIKTDNTGDIVHHACGNEHQQDRNIFNVNGKRGKVKKKEKRFYTAPLLYSGCPKVHQNQFICIEIRC